MRGRSVLFFLFQQLCCAERHRAVGCGRARIFMPAWLREGVRQKSSLLSGIGKRAWKSLGNYSEFPKFFREHVPKWNRFSSRQNWTSQVVISTRESFALVCSRSHIVILLLLRRIQFRIIDKSRLGWYFVIVSSKSCCSAVIQVSSMCYCHEQANDYLRTLLGSFFLLGCGVSG